MDAERHTNRCERDVAVDVMENCSWVISFGAWTDMLLAWARDRVVVYMNVLGMQRDLPEEWASGKFDTLLLPRTSAGTWVREKESGT